MVQSVRRWPTRPGRALALVLAAGLSHLGTACQEPAAPEVHLAFLSVPTGGVAGQPLSPIAVSVRDPAGRPLSGTVSLALHDNHCLAALSGTLAADAVDGVAEFGNVVIDVPQRYRLEARVGGATTVSATFDLTGGVPGHTLELLTTLCSRPNSQGDAEAITYVPDDDDFWIGDDNRPSVFRVARGNGAYGGQLDSAAFLAAFPDAGACDDGDGDPSTSCSYLAELEGLAYDPDARRLYVVNTVNDPAASPPVDKPAIYRLRKDSCRGCLAFESWQPLPVGPKYGAMVAARDSIYVAVGRNLYAYDYAANRVHATDADGDSLPPAYRAPTAIRDLAFDGPSLWVLGSGAVYEIEWASGAQLGAHDLGPFAIHLPKGIEVVHDTVYVVDGRYPNRIYVLQRAAP